MNWRMVLLALALWAGGMVQGGQSRDEQIYRRATAEFETATYAKPVATSSEDLVFKLAPLVLELGEGTDRGRAGFGALTISNGVLAVNTSAPTIYFDTGVVVLKSRPHLQLVYVWFYPPVGQSPLAQGVRITMDSTGQPVIWEVLRDGSGLQPVFAAHSLEQAAAKEHGKPLLGRHYSLEPERKAPPKVIVARVIEDGPMPMGPMVYVESESRDIATILCRCMPPQFKSLVATRTYDLAPLTSARSLLQTLPQVSKGGGRQPELFDSPNASGRSVEELRLPAEW